MAFLERKLCDNGENAGSWPCLLFSQCFEIFSFVVVKSQDPFVNPLPNGKFFDWFKLKAFANDKLNVTVKMKFVLGTVEHIVGKGGNAGYQHFLLFPQCFQKASYIGSLKVMIVW